jgi:hypothetical protein
VYTLKWRQIVLGIALVFCELPLSAQKPAKHYFSNTLYVDFYSPATKRLDTINTISKKLSSYKISQLSLGFNIPVVTKEYYNKDSTHKANIHLLITGNFSNIKLNFAGISTHNLMKAGLGFRGIFNNGKRSVFYGELMPFVTQDYGYKYTTTYRMAFTILYNFSVNENLAFRLGYTRSFMWGNRFNMPYLGIRVGKVDKTNLSIQFPRNITFTMPAGKAIRLSAYIKPQGGVYSFANVDNIPVGNFLEDKQLYFGRYELLGGFRMDVNPVSGFSFYASTGINTQNYISFFPTETETNSKFSTYREYYLRRLRGGVFVNVGLVFRFGKTRSYYQYNQLYNAHDLNNNLDENGIKLGNTNIPSAQKTNSKKQLNEVIDLIDTRDIE